MSVKINIIDPGTAKRKLCQEENRLPSMEAVHHPDDRPWIGEKINVGKHFSKYSRLVASSRVPGLMKPDMKFKNKKLKELMESSSGETIGEEMFNEIVENCDIEKFTINREMEPQQQNSESKAKYSRFVAGSVKDIPSVGVKNLKTLEYQQEFMEKANDYERYKRMRGLRNPNNAHFDAAPPPPSRLNLDLLDKEILVAVRIYRPIKSSTKNVAASMTTAHRFVQEIHMLGSNKLSQLRDLIKCSGDYMGTGEMSEKIPLMKSTEKLDSKAVEEYKSAFFFIEDTFYNDNRWPECQDLSKVIRDWASDPRRKIGPFKTAVMEDTCIKDLTLRLGYPYVYVHQGDHEHLITFVEDRLLSADDSQRPSSYPFERSTGMIHSKMCMVCTTFIAKWVTENNDRVPEDPFFFCDDCFRQFNYSPKNEKIGNFRAYPFIDVNAL